MSEKDAAVSQSQYATFFISDRLYGIDVMKVQEITKTLPITPVPLAPPYVHGLINLRGQIATAIGLRELFKLDPLSKEKEAMNVVCRFDGQLISLLVDQIGDVLEVDSNHFEATPDTVNPNVTKFMTGVYKLDRKILSIINVETIIDILNR